MDVRIIKKAFKLAVKEQEVFIDELVGYNEHVLHEAKHTGNLTILLAGRPYHTDPLIQHKISNMLSIWGIHVITDDIVRTKDISVHDVHFVAAMGIPGSYFKSSSMVYRTRKGCSVCGDDFVWLRSRCFSCG